MKLKPFLYAMLVIYASFIFDRAVIGHGMMEDSLTRFDNHETVHESMGQVHFPPVTYDRYISKLNYSKEFKYSKRGLGPVYDFTHSVFEFLAVSNTSYLMPDYVKRTNTSIFTLGQSYEQNEWLTFLNENKVLMLLWILPLLLLIIIMPFIGVIYCCFCCCRCKNVCAPCEKTHLKRIIYSILMFLLILALVLAFLIAILSHKQMSRLNEHSYEQMLRGSKDTCAFLKDISLHMHHLFIVNYGKLKDQVTEEATTAHKHILLDLVDTDKNALTELEQILQNMPQAIKILKDIDKAEKNLRFFASVYRDSLRGIKRDLVYLMVSLCGLTSCKHFVVDLLKLDHSVCLHLDDLPNSTIFETPMQSSVEKNLHEIVKRSLQRLSGVGNTIKEAINPIIPPLLSQLDHLGIELKVEYLHVNEIIDAVVSDIHLRILHTANSFDDINHLFGRDRKVFTNLACFALLVIIIALTFGLILGLFVPQTNVGSHCMIFAVLFMFCVISFITLVGLFYYVLGMVTYQAACKRLSEMESDRPSKAQITNAIAACRADQHIFDLLKENNLYDIKRLEDLDFDTDKQGMEVNKFSGNLTGFALLTIQDINLLNTTLYELHPYRGDLFTKMLCKNLSTPTLSVLESSLNSFFYNEMYAKGECGNVGRRIHYACTMVAIVLRQIHLLQSIRTAILKCIETIINRTKQLDALIVRGDSNFGETMNKLIDTIQKTESFIRERGSTFIDTLGLNLTRSIHEKLIEFRTMLISELKHNVGCCRPLSYIQDPGTKFACRELIDPINGFWVGLLLSALLLLPALFVAHKLICLYRRRDKPAVVFLKRYDGCPTCSGAPYVPHPVVICSGAKQTDCPCPDNQWNAFESHAVYAKKQS